MALMITVMIKEHFFQPKGDDIDAKVVELETNPEPITSIEEYEDGLWIQESACNSAMIATLMGLIGMFAFSMVVGTMPVWTTSLMKTWAVLSVSTPILGQFVLSIICLFTPKARFANVFPLASLIYTGLNYVFACGVHYLWTVVPDVSKTRVSPALYIAFTYGMILAPLFILVIVLPLFLFSDKEEEEEEEEEERDRNSNVGAWILAHRNAVWMFIYYAVPFHGLVVFIMSLERLRLALLSFGIIVYSIALIYYTVRYATKTRGEPLPFVALDIANVISTLMPILAVGIAVLQHLF